MVSLKEFADCLETPSDEAAYYLNPQTGEIRFITDEQIGIIERGDDEKNQPHWLQEVLPQVREVLESDQWLTLPGSYEVHEWEIMDRFSSSRDNDQHREELMDAIRGRGAFRHFKNTVRHLGIEQDWFKYKHEALEEIARDWLESHDLAYE